MRLWRFSTDRDNDVVFSLFGVLHWTRYKSSCLFSIGRKACGDCGPTSPVWVEGEPANLEAAAADALVWLRVFCEQPGALYLWGVNRERLQLATDALAGFMPQRSEPTR